MGMSTTIPSPSQPLGTEPLSTAPLSTEPLSSAPPSTAPPSTAPLSSAPLTAAAAVDNAMSTILDSIVEVDRMLASLCAYRAVAIDEVRQLAAAADARPSSEGRRGG